MPVNRWRRWMTRAWCALECAEGPPRRTRRPAAAPRLEELESRLTPSTFPAYPFVASIQRADPVGPVTAAGAVRFTVAFSKAVTGVDPTDFRVAPTGTVQAQSLQVTPVSASVYTVTVGGITGTGGLGLNLVDNGSIRDLAGNPLVQQNAPASFRSLAGSFPPAGGPFAVAAADLNRDGKTDLVVADGSNIDVLLGNGDGTFHAATSYPQDAAPVSVAVADVNGDGKLDIVFAGGAVGVLLGNGDGTFQGSNFFFSGGNATFVTVADVNGDGKPDLIVANSGGGQPGSVSVLIGNGDGTFQPPSVMLPVANPTSVAVADVNGDGIPDLVVADAATGTVDVFLGVGKGGFRGPLASPAGPNPSSLAVADLNGDGIPDVVVTNPGSNAVSVLIGKGDGTFQSPVAFAAGQGPADVAIADVNGDGNPDLIVADSTGQDVAVLLGDGAGGFAAPSAFLTGPNPASVTVADLNGDGRPDVVAADQSGGGGVLLGDGNGSFAGQAYDIDPTQVPGDILLSLSGVAIAANQTLTLQGTFGDPGALDTFAVDISWGDGSPDTVLNLSTQARSFAAPHVYTAEGTFVVTATVTDSGGDAAVSSLVLPVQPAAFGPIAVVQDQPGQMATASAGTPGAGFFGAVTLTQSPDDAHGVELLLAQLATTAVASFDVREFGATALDVGVVTFQFPTTLLPGTPLELEFLDPKTGTLQTFRPDGQPGSFVLFVDQGFVFGRVLFDNASTPKLTQLTGTEFTVAVAVPGSPSNVAAVSRALTSANPGAAAPLGAAAFQSTSQLTFSLAPSQASQLSAGLLSVSNASAAGGGGTETEDSAVAAWVEFVADEFGDDPQAVWQYGGEAALRLWVQKPRRPRPPAAPAPAEAPAPPAAPGRGETPRLEIHVPAPPFLFRDPAPPPAAPGPPVAAVDGPRPPPPADPPTRPSRACLGAASLAGLAIPIYERIRRKKRRGPTGR